ncbi:MAG: glycosyltransferase family 4 protein [Bacteroidales bacterium]|nr:glycosyltransferase family 4 protein [Bacteroidales bacterium]
MKLITLPCNPSDYGGYGRAVRDDLARLKIGNNDVIVIYDRKESSDDSRYEYIPRHPAISLHGIMNIARGRVWAELSKDSLRKIVNRYNIEEVFVGDTILYRAVKELFPAVKMTVRFHNLYLLPWVRVRTRKINIDLAARTLLELASRLELQILNDELANHIFISDNDANMAKLLFPNISYKVWTIEKIVAGVEPTPPGCQRLVYSGSLAAHQKCGVVEFIRGPYRKLRKRHPKTRLEIYGRRGRELESVGDNIKWCGDWKDTPVPKLDGGGLFVNPDILGAGIKYKIGDWIASGTPFISTPYGIQGYRITESPHRLIAPLDKWDTEIEKYWVKWNVG